MLLPNLAASTKYYYRIKVTDASNSTAQQEGTFTTPTPSPLGGGNVPFDQMLVTGSGGTGAVGIAAGSGAIHATYTIPRNSLRGRRL